MRELRYDPLSGTWVLIAPGRSLRPGSHRHRRRSRPWPTPERVPSCPFCPGNEDQTPPEIARAGGPPAGPGWQARLFSNRYPITAHAASDPLGPGTDPGHGLRRRLGGGAHEVVVLDPRHDVALATMRPEQAAVALRMLLERMRVHLAAGRRCVQVFLNHEPAAGASIDHPHAQVVAMDVVPPLVEREAAALSGDGCLLCRAIHEECQPGGPRVLLRGEVAAWCPFWASAPYELLLAPRVHAGRLEDAGEVVAGLGESLVLLLRCLDRAAGDPAYNLVVHSAPAGVDDFHWHLHVRPKLSEPGGFELGTGMAVVELAPEEAARELRDAHGDGFPASSVDFGGD